MKHLLRSLGIIGFWLGWPFYFVYFRLSRRTRILLVRGEEVLVVSNWLSDGRWNLPGGGLHRGEDPAKGVLRELKEELGVTIPSEGIQRIGTYIYKAYGHRYPYSLFVAVVDGELPLTLQWYEIAGAEWLHYSVLNSRNATSDVPLAIQAWRDLPASRQH